MKTKLSKTAYLQIQIRYNVNNDEFEDTLIAALMRVPNSRS